MSKVTRYVNQHKNICTLGGVWVFIAKSESEWRVGVREQKKN